MRENQENREGEVERKSWMEMLRNELEHAGERISGEFANSASDWVSCLGSVLFRAEMYLEMANSKGDVPADVYASTAGILESLKQRKHELAEQYPEKKDVPPEETRNELLRTIASLKEKI